VQLSTAAAPTTKQSVGVGVQGTGIGAVVFGLKPTHSVGVIVGVGVGVGVQSSTAKGNSTKQSEGVGVGVGVHVATVFAAAPTTAT